MIKRRRTRFRGRRRGRGFRKARTSRQYRGRPSKTTMPVAIKDVKPAVFEWAHGIAMYSNLTYASAFFLEADANDNCDTVSLGTGASAAQYPSLSIDSPQLLLRMQGAGVFASLLPGAAAQLNASQMVYWLSPRTYRWNITNSQNHPVKLSMYWCQPRHDLPIGTTAYTGLPTVYVAKDNNDQAARCFAADGIFTYGTTEMRRMIPSFAPYESTTFCTLYKILRHADYELKAGQCLELKHVAKDWWKLTDYYLRSYEKVNGFPGRSITPFVVVRGCPVTNSGFQSRTDIGASHVNFRYSAECKVYMLNVAKQLYYKSYNSAPGGAVAAPGSYMSAPVAGYINEN